MSLPTMSLGLRFCASRMVVGPDSMPASGLSYRKPLTGTRWATSLINGLSKQFSVLIVPPFLAVWLFSQFVVVTVGPER